MSGLAVDTNQLRRLTGVGGLQSCGILERMGRDYTVIVVGSRDHYRRIGSAVVADIMQRRVAEEICGHLGGVGRCAIVGAQFHPIVNR